LVGIHYPDLPDPRVQALEAEEEPETARNFSLEAKNTIGRIPKMTQHKRLNTWSKSSSNLYKGMNTKNLGLFEDPTNQNPLGKGVSPSPKSASRERQMSSASHGPINFGQPSLLAPGGGDHSMHRRASRSYSALHDRPKKDEGIQSVSPSNELYYIGLIDVLVEFGLWKRGEYLYKGYLRGHGQKMSVIPPQPYAKRFIDFVSSVIK